LSRLTSTILIAVALGASALAQVNPICDFTVRVRVEDRVYGGQALVEVLAPGGSLLEGSGINADGSARFEVQSGATYTVRVSGPNIETTSARFYIMGGELNHMEYVNVKMETSASETKPKQETRSSTVSVGEMNVPAKAKEQMQMGTDAFNRGEMPIAKQCFEKAVSIYPKYARAYANLGIIAAKSGDRAKARELFGKAIEADDKFLPAYVAIARMDLQDKDYKKAEEELRKIVNQDATMTDALALLASAEFGNKDYDDALRDAQRVHLAPNHQQYATTHLLAAQVLEMQGRYDEALAEYRIFLKEDPTSPQVPQVQQAVADLQAGKH